MAQAISAEQITIIRSQLDASGYRAGAAEIQAANRDIAASGQSVVQQQSGVTRSLTDGGAAFNRLRLQVDEAARANQAWERAVTTAARAVASGRTTVADANSVLDAYAQKLRLVSDAAQLAAERQGQLAAAVARAAQAQAAINGNLGVRDPLGGDALKQRAADIAAYGNEMDRLRAKYNPLFAVSKAYEAELDDISKAEKVGALTAIEAAAARGRTTAAFAASAAPMKKAGDAAGHAAHGSAAITRELIVMGHEAMTGRWTRLPGSMLVLAERTGGLATKLKDVAVALGTTPVGWTILAGTAIAAGLTAMAVGAEHAANRLIELQNQLRATHDAAEAATLGHDAMGAARTLAATTTLHTTDARSAAQEIASAPQFHGTQQQLEALVLAASNAAIALGTKLPDEAKVFVQAMDDPAKAVQDMADKHLVGFNQQMADAANKMQQAGDKAGAMDLYLRGMSDTFHGVAQNLTPLDKALLDLENAFSGAKNGGKDLSTTLGTLVLNGLTGLINSVTTVVNLAERAYELSEKVKGSNGQPAELPPATSFGDRFLQGAGQIARTMAWPITHPFGMTGQLAGYLSGSSTSTPNQSVPADIQPMIAAAAQQTGVDPAVGAQLYRQEAVRNPDGSFQTSSAGAMGALQVTPATFAEMQRRYGFAGNITDNQANITAGMYRYSEMLQQFHDTGLAAGAYDMGPQGMADTLNGNRALPDETARYIRNFQAGYHGTGYAPGLGVPGALPANQLGDITGPSGTGAGAASASDSGISYNSLPDMLKMINSMSLTTDAADKLKREVVDMGTAISEAVQQKDWASVERLGAGYEKLQGDIYRTVTTQQQFTRDQQLQLETAQPLTEGDRRLVSLQQQLRQHNLEHPESATTPQQDQQAIDMMLRQQSAAAAQTGFQNSLTIAQQQALAGAQSPADVIRLNAANEAHVTTMGLFPQSSPVQFNAEQASLTQQNMQKATGAENDQLHQQSFANDNQLQTLGAETAAIGENDRARTLALAHLQAEIAIRQQFPVADQAYVDAYVKGVDTINAAKYDFRQAQQAFDELSSTVERSMTTVTSAITDSLEGKSVNWVNVAKQLVEQVIEEFMKLAVINPLMNSMFHEGRPTLDSVGGVLGDIGGGGGAGGGTGGGGGGGGSGMGGGLFGGIDSVVGAAAKQWGGAAWGGISGLWGGNNTANTTDALKAMGNVDGPATPDAVAAAGASNDMFSGVGDFFSSIFHEGGVVGGSAPGRTVDAAVFANASRYHDGLGNDEFPAILQRGERVLTANQNSQLMNQMSSLTSPAQSGQSGPQIHFHINTPNADSFKASQGQLYAKANAALAKSAVRG